MSIYTDFQHEYILKETERWKCSPPKTPAEYYQFGQFQYCIKDFYKACFYYQKAVDGNYIPAAYSLANCMKKKEGISFNPQIEKKLFAQAFCYYARICQQQIFSDEDKSICISRLGTCYVRAYGTECNITKGKDLLYSVSNENGAAAYELGLLCETVRDGFLLNYDEALAWYRKSYDLLYEDGIFKHFSLFQGEFSEYPYQREIKEAYSFKLGQLMRLSTVSPCKDSFTRLALLYEKGYPGDSGDDDIRFKEKALNFRKKAAQAENDYIFGKFLVFPDSSVYKTYVSPLYHV